MYLINIAYKIYIQLTLLVANILLYHESEDNIDQILFDPITILHD